MGWEGFFPYYAGFPEQFADGILGNSGLGAGTLVGDPWNGSGTTTFVASTLGFSSIGIDVNPVMVVVAKARLLPPSEADSIIPLGGEIVRQAALSREPLSGSDPLLKWLGPSSAESVRAIERSIRRHLVSEPSDTLGRPSPDKMSGIAATNYVALFSVCRELCASFRASNPTWLRFPREGERRAGAPREFIADRFRTKVRAMANALLNRAEVLPELGMAEIKLGSSVDPVFENQSVDLFLTSPPYCTRIDYTAATRIELAVLEPLCYSSPTKLSYEMIGSTRVPQHAIAPSSEWGAACIEFLRSLRAHPSKASAGYYYKTHLDYFDKLSRSLKQMDKALKVGGRAIIVVQDSYYKNVHNDIPLIVTEMAEIVGLRQKHREDFRISRTMANMNPKVRAYRSDVGATEAVICFERVD